MSGIVDRIWTKPESYVFEYTFSISPLYSTYLYVLIYTHEISQRYGYNLFKKQLIRVKADPGNAL